MRLESETEMTARGSCRRLVGVLVLVLGIIGMHELSVVPGHASSHAPQVVHVSAPAAAAAVDDCSGDAHCGFHACVFVLTSVLGLAALTLLCRIGAAGDLCAPARIRELLRSRQRAPPWTVLTLAEMSLLRI